MKRLIPLLLLASCAKEDPSFSQSTHVTFSELVSKVKNRVNEPQMQWLVFEGKMKGYINVFVGELKSKLASHRELRVKIETDQGHLSFKAPLRKGDQRVTIPEKITPKLLDLLEKSKSATLSLSGYKTKLNLKQFKRMLNKAKKQDRLENFKSTTLFDL